jgi:hypothetical protein
VYSKTKKEFDDSANAILALKGFPKFVKRFQKALKRESEWAIHARDELLHRKNHTNNYSEASIKIIKEVGYKIVQKY